MQRFLAILLITIFFVACKDSVPEEIIPESKMTDILLDLHVADGYMLYGSAASENRHWDYFSGIYKRYGTDSASVRKSLEYYASHPQKLQDIYAEISKRLHAMETGINEEERKKGIAIYKADSVKRRRVMDSIYYQKRDSILYGKGIDHALVIKADSLDSTAWSLPGEQLRVELILGYPLPAKPKAPGSSGKPKVSEPVVNGTGAKPKLVPKKVPK